MPRDERERFAHLFEQLMVDGEREDVEADHLSALRLLSHSLLNVLGTFGTDAAVRLAGAAPWLAGFLDVARAESDLGEVVDRLAQSPATSTLSRGMIHRRLAACEAERSGCVGLRPRADRGGDRHATAIAELAELDDRLAALVELPDDELRARLMEDSATLAAACELCEDAADGPLADRLRDAFAPWRFEESVPHRLRRSDALWALAALEDEEDSVDPFDEGGFELSERARGFERGLAQNMVRLDLIAAVRAALAFGPVRRDPQPADLDELEALFRRFAVFRADPALHRLALALCSVRGRCIDYVCGGAPLESLSDWIAYLRGPCNELAELRECTLREAMSYAHYCLHLVDVCDFSTMGPEALCEETRQTLMSVEEELKEFALAGQREGLSDVEADLGRFERARWRRPGEAAYLADRLSRLRGAWRDGISPGPVGAPPRLDEQVLAHSMALIENLVDEASESDLTALADMLGRARLVGYEWLERLEPRYVLDLLAVAVASARDVGRVDVSRPFTIDLGPLGRWVEDRDRARVNRRILEALLEQHSTRRILQEGGEPSALRRGIVGQARPGAAPGGRLQMRFVADDELQALLDLMGVTDAESDDFHAMLEARLHELLHRNENDVAPQQDEAPPREPPAPDVRRPGLTS
ncbi:MAG: hypothetical protein ACOCV2_07865 [Persicimonas sp.]